MPAHIPIPKNDPPTLRDRIDLHSSDAGLAALLTLPVASQVFLAPLLPGYTPSNTLSTLSVIASVVMAVMLGAGGVLATMGLFWRGNIVSTGWALEKVGFIFVGGGWGGFAWMAFDRNPTTTIAWYIPLVLSFLAFYRYRVVKRIEAEMRPRAEAARKQRKEGKP